LEGDLESRLEDVKPSQVKYEEQLHQVAVRHVSNMSRILETGLSGVLQELQQHSQELQGRQNTQVPYDTLVQNLNKLRTQVVGMQANMEHLSTRMSDSDPMKRTYTGHAEALSGVVTLMDSLFFDLYYENT
jgi:hypothetical protein